jgi:hypothetical protein
VPVVLLCGFAGCSFHPTAASIPLTLTATPRNVDHITVSWQNTDPNQVFGYRFLRKKADEIQTTSDLDASITTVDDTDLEEATVYTYEVSPIFEHGPGSSSTTTVSTFTTAFDVAAAVPIAQAVGPGDYCFVQRISAGQLLASGGKVGLKVRSTSSGNATINNIYISRAAGSGNLWDSAADLTPVMISGLTLPDDQPVDLDPIDYNLDQTQDLIIAFDFTATSSAGNIRFVAPPGVTLYFKQGVQQASMPTRDPDYFTQPDPRLYLVVTIGVA